eukprot:496545-Hanusia_phi.AAC.2
MAAEEGGGGVGWQQRRERELEVWTCDMRWISSRSETPMMRTEPSVQPTTSSCPLGLTQMQVGALFSSTFCCSQA